MSSSGNLSSFTSGLFASLQANQSTTYAPTMAPTNATDQMRLASSSDGRTLRDTFMVYGGMLVVIFLTFCYVRRAFHKPYTIRRWVEECKVSMRLTWKSASRHVQPFTCIPALASGLRCCVWSTLYRELAPSHSSFSLRFLDSPGRRSVRFLFLGMESLQNRRRYNFGRMWHGYALLS